MLDCEPPKEDASEDNGGVSDPELEVVQMLERECPIVPGLGRVKETSWATQSDQKTGLGPMGRSIPNENEANSSPSAMRQLSSRL